MARLYPPYIEGKLPAFIYNGQKVTIKVPFQLNAAVGRNEFDSMAIIIKTVQTNVIKVNGATTKSIGYDYNSKQLVANFNLDNFIPQIGQYYKIQVAFVSGDELGYYSTVGVIKCTAEPEIGIEKLTGNTAINYHQYEYTGYYKQTKDKAEKVYTYKFDLYDEAKQLVATSGELLHNSSADTSTGESKDTWIVEKDLDKDRMYYIKYSVNTINNYYAESAEYTIIKMDTVDINAEINLTATPQPDDGCVNIGFELIDPASVVVGSFALLRASSEDNYQTWPEIFRFDLNGAFPQNKPFLWKDFTVQQGLNYKYALQAYNSNNFYSNRLEALNPITKENFVYVDFEDSFLTDGERQLKIKFNPKVTSFKSTILESKVNTLGGQYPFIFRNGNVEYKEFPISGLLSVLSDEKKYFTKGLYNNEYTETKRDRTSTKRFKVEENATDLTSEQIRKEREFKIQVLEWLNNGKPKLFRSPTEGNYIVRLMNASLTPVDTLGRMLHSFNCNACEIAKNTFENLNKYNFITTSKQEYRMMSFQQINLVESFGTVMPEKDTELKIPGNLYFARLEDQYQGELHMSFYYADGTSIINYRLDNSTGIMNIPILNNTSLERIVYNSGLISNDAKLTIGYYDSGTTNIFSQITNMNIETKVEEYIGENKDFISQIENIKQKTGRFYRINLEPRTVKNVYKGLDDNYYEDPNLTMLVTNWVDSYLYKVVGEGIWLDGGLEKPVFAEAPNFMAQINNEKISFADNNVITEEEFNKQIAIDQLGKPILISTATYFNSLQDVEKVDKLILGNGVQALIVYQLKTISYAIEETDEELVNSQIIIASRKVYLKEKEEEYAKEPTEALAQEIEQLRMNIVILEKAYLDKLNTKIEAQKKEGVIYAI